MRFNRFAAVAVAFGLSMMACSQAQASIYNFTFSDTLGDTGAGSFNVNGGLGSPLTFSFSVSAVPEPSTWAMIILGFAAISFIGYRRSRKGAVLAA